MKKCKLEGWMRHGQGNLVGKIERKQNGTLQKLSQLEATVWKILKSLFKILNRVALGHTTLS